MRPSRPSRPAILVAVLCLVATALAVRVWAPSGEPDEGLSPSASPERPARTTQLPLASRLTEPPASDRSARSLRGKGQLQTQLMDVPAYSMVALTWTDDADLHAEVRTRADGQWSDWQELEPLGDLGREEGSGVRGSEPWWVKAADGVQVRMQGPKPRGLELVLIDPGHLRSDEEAAQVEPGEQEAALSLSSGAAATTAPRPYLHSRRKWGANESLRNGSPTILPQVKQIFVHHTATANGYAREDVPGIIRSMYRYHTQSLGWSDIGYNFIVDRFGRSWVGRAGGYWRAVQGAHALGFNHTSAGIAVIGTYSDLRPSLKSVTALVRLSAWKLDLYGHPPAGRVRVLSRGSDRYARGTEVRLPRIVGHRDTGYTACPGQQVYNRLPEIRDRAQTRATRYS